MHNDGALFFRNAPAQPGSTIIVTGVGRSGTSMLAKALETLGIHMGKTNNALHEDLEMHEALFYFFHHDRSDIIARRNAEHASWGFKFVALQRHMSPAELSQFRNPRLMVVTRDPVAIASRISLSDPAVAGPAAALAMVVKQQADLVSFTEEAACPTMMLSYEKFLAKPDRQLSAIAEFCGLEPAALQFMAALRDIEPDNRAYIDVFHAAAE